MDKVYFNASDVAALINRHKYRSQLEAIEQVKRGKLVDSELVKFTQNVFIKDMTELDERATAIAATKGLDYTDVRKELVKNRGTIEERDILEHVVREDLAKQAVVPDCQTVERVINSETIDEQKQAVKRKHEDAPAQVPQNKKRKLHVMEFGSFKLGGRTDGISGDRIVEIKNRTHKFMRCPPEYDIVQLRCYMKLLGCVDGKIVEKFPDGTYRETLVDWCDNEWNMIESALAELVEQHFH